MTSISVSTREKLEVLSEGKKQLLKALLERSSNASQQIKPLPRDAGAGPIRLPTSGAQKRLWFIDQIEGGSTAYHIPVAIRIGGGLDRTALTDALNALVHRHEILRTVFVAVNGEPLQEIAPVGRFLLRQTDVSGELREDREGEVLRLSHQELSEPFDLRSGPLVRGRLIQLGEDEHVLLITMHHIVSDGWSIDVLIRELMTLYASCCQGRPDSLPPLTIQYADYVQWQSEWLLKAERDRQLSYWKEHLKGAPGLMELPSDRPRPAAQSYRGATINVVLGGDLAEQLRVVSRQHDLTLAMTLYAAWCITLARLSGQEDIVVGTLVANRGQVELEGLIGFFVNTLAVRVRLDTDPTAAELLEQVKATMLGAYAHQQISFEQVVEALQPARSLSYSPIFQAMFVMQNTPRSELQLSGLTLVEQEVPLQTAKFDLLLSLQESSGDICGTLNYATDLFHDATVRRWVECFKSILSGLALQTHLPVSKLPLLNQAERYEVAEGFNATQASYPQEKLIHQLIEEQVARTPLAIAVEYEGESLTYAQINGRANQLARHLRSKGVGPDRLVGICTERSLAMVIGLLGILKAGAAYVPLDPNYPAERLEYMLQDAAPEVLLSQTRLRAKLPNVASEVIELDGDWAHIAVHGTDNLDADAVGLNWRHLAYVIYTSGSTGRPKGAMNEHRALINRLHWMQSQYELDGSDRVLQKTPFSFDVSVWEFFWTLMTGARLIVARPQGHQDPEYLRGLIEDAGVTTLHFVPSMLQIFLDRLRANQCLGLRRVVCSGEELPTSLQSKFFECLPHAQLSNLYGPTEAAIDVTSWECRADDPIARVPIGRPIWNVQMYVLDRHNQPVPIGVVGEIYIGGAGVGRGYLNRPELTAERFLPDPLDRDPRARMYKTGDLGRWRADGAIEYLGRNDFQVKIRGFRIELGEIEARLSSHEQLKEVVVVACDNGSDEKRLIAYVVPLDHAAAPGIEELRAHLKAALPEHMVPSAFVTLQSMPLTPNGKLDRRALPAPELAAYSSRQYQAPRGDVEEILAGIWEALLRVERVGRQDNFFELGGHSLLIVQLMERLNRVGLSTQLRRAFDSQTLADMASALVVGEVDRYEAPPNLIPDDCDAITPEMLPLVQLERQHIDAIARQVPGGTANIQDIYPLVPLQEGVLFHHLLDEQNGDTYVMPLVLSVASRRRLEELCAALQQVIDRHDVLRTAVLWEDLPRPVQVVYRKAALQVTQVALDPRLELAEQIREWTQPARQRLDLRQAPLIRLQIAPDRSSDQWYALLQLHHMTIDHVTFEIVTSEIVAYLNGRELQSLETIPYRNHVAQSLTYADQHDAEDFFRSKLADVDEPTVPFGLLDVRADGSRIEEGRRVLDAALANRIRTQSRRHGVSAATLFHAAWSLVVARTSGRDDVVFGTVLLGRLQGGADAQRILGVFINTLPLRLKLRDKTATELVEYTQRELIELVAHEQASLATSQRCSGLIGTTPLFSALLNYRHSVPNVEADWSSAGGIGVLACQERTNYPLTVSVDDLGAGFALTALSDRRIDPNRITGYLYTAVRALTEALEHAPHTQALALSILPEDEFLHLVEEFNATQMPYPHTKLIHELFEEQTERAPYAVAVVCADQHMTFRELNSRANQLAGYLRHRGVGRGRFVGLCVRRGIDMVVGVLGILKAGGAYVPLDPNYPQHRLEYMLQDTAPVAVLTHAELRNRLPVTGLTIALDTQWNEISKYPRATSSRDRTLSSSDLAYVIYTSGSTGRPKGVAIEHRNAVNLIWWAQSAMAVEVFDEVLHSTSMNFDLSVYECFVPLSTGGTIRVVENALALMSEPPTVTLINSVPSAVKAMLDSGEIPPAVRVVNLAGEVLKEELVERIIRGSAVDRVCNLYGPSETTTYSTWISMSRDIGFVNSIGRPIANTSVYILDRHRQVTPLGVEGEIYIGGSGVARGYLNHPELTAERFLADPFSPDPRARMYKTGDLGRWCLDGTIEYRGRNDHQVKVRGFRIELGEVEAQMMRHAQVKEAVVVEREDVSGEKRLVAYVIPQDLSASPSTDVLRAHLKAALPEYMVPGTFLILERMPRTPNGKLDRNALPAPERVSGSGERSAPQGAAEETIAAIWQELLQVECVGRQDNFFEIGGHSLLAVRALTQINHQLGCSLRLADIYKHPVLLELAARTAGGSIDERFVDLSTEATLGDEVAAQPGAGQGAGKAVLLTGGTGFVGRFLLAQLLQDTDAIVYCVVRAQTQRQALSRLTTTLSKWVLWRDEFEQRIVAIPGDLRLPRLGLDEVTYQNLARQTDTIFHCATSMNHLETYAMAKPANVEAVKDLLKLATLHRPKLFNYISTLSVFSAATHDAVRSIDERSSIDCEKHPVSSGYSASKWVGEKIVMNAAERGVPCNIFRIGLVWADTKLGRYDELQREYRILKSSLLSGCGIKDYRYELAPTPVDYVARAAVALASEHREGGRVFHIASGRTAEEIFERLNQAAGASLDLLSHFDWIQQIKRLHYQGRSLPVVPLVEFAFSMDVEAFHAHQRRSSAPHLTFECSFTTAELERIGILEPVFNDDRLITCVEWMSSRDSELQAMSDYKHRGRLARSEHV